MTDQTPSNPEKKSPTRLRWMLAVLFALVLSAWLINTPPGLEGKADAVGYAICHQIPARSFQVNGEPISLCARCTGMYVGAFVGLVYQFILGRRRAEWPGKGITIVFGVFFLAFAVDGTNSAATLYFGEGPLYETTNLSRLLTGTGLGLGMAGMILPTFHQSMWKRYDPRPYFLNWRQSAGYLAAGFGSAALILTGQPFFLIPFTYVGILGIMAVLVLLYCMIAMVVLNRENQADSWGDALPWLLIGLILAVLHIGAIDLGRFWLTGTWEGFHL